MRKKIIIFTPTIYAIGGESRVVTVIANELEKKYDVTIYTREKYLSESIYNLSPNILVKSYYPYSKKPMASMIRFLYRKTKNSFFENHVFLLDYAYYSKNAVNKMNNIINNYDIAIAVSGDFSILLGKCSNMDVMKIGWEHNSYEAYFETPHKYLWKRDQIFANSAKNLDKCIVLNEDISEKYKNKLNVKSMSIYNPRSFTSEKKSNLTNKQFVACGNFVEAKGFDLLIEAFSIFSKKDSEWKLKIVGDGIDMKKIKHLIHKYQLEDRIILPGYINDVKNILQESTIYLLSSRWEGFPMCVTEAYEFGLPMVCFDIPAVIPLTRHNEGIVVKKYDTNEFANAMYSLSSNHELICEMSKNALSMANSISIENISKQWFKILEERDV